MGREGSLMVKPIEERTVHRDTHPDPDWVRGVCHDCGSPVVSNTYYVGGKGYIIQWECWKSLGPMEEQTCDYKRVI